MATEIRYRDDGDKAIRETARVHPSGTLYGAPVFQSRCGPIMTIVENLMARIPRPFATSHSRITAFDRDMKNRA
jgi:ubiquinone/menaquinone biosynthesis C-methylase UbiE